ncbi:MAG: hypothetical protein J5I93_22685 [Pirellulaceae bacterium]|nr:hypothetical protein [Pirellulaceae bacterium]
MKRVTVRIDQVASIDSLVAATERASRGRRTKPGVYEFLRDLLVELDRLQAELFAETYRPAPMRQFEIRDPKPRRICAPTFRDRVVHHALMAPIGPMLEREMVDGVCACRRGFGTRAAIAQCRRQLARGAWYGKCDIRSYFASVPHQNLLDLVARRIKPGPVMRLLENIVRSHEDSPGRGLPIGALTSQWLANYYLVPLDRFLLEECGVSGYVRYMDDFVFWGRDRETICCCCRELPIFLRDALRLELKRPPEVNRSRHGVTLCGFRVHTGFVRLARSRKARFQAKVRQREWEYRSGKIGRAELQRLMDSALAILGTCDTAAWRRGWRATRNGLGWEADV